MGIRVQFAQLISAPDRQQSLPNTATNPGAFKEHMKKPESSENQSASRLIDRKIAKPEDWRVATLEAMRKLIEDAAPGVVEESKWRKPSNSMRGVPVWSHNGIICTGETYKDKVKLTFAKGASLDDPSELFNSSLDGNARRAIDIHEGESVNARAFKQLFRAAADFNSQSRTGKAKRAK